MWEILHMLRTSAIIPIIGTLTKQFLNNPHSHRPRIRIIPYHRRRQKGHQSDFDKRPPFDHLDLPKCPRPKHVEFTKQRTVNTHDDSEEDKDDHLRGMPICSLIRHFEQDYFARSIGIEELDVRRSVAGRLL